MSDAKAGRIIVGVIGALYIAFILVGFAKYEGQQNSQQYQQGTQTNPRNGTSAKATVIDVKPNAAPEGNPCEQGYGDNWQDLCQQWRMAKAAEDLTSLTKTQIGVTVLEVALLIAVLIYTAKATLANTEANRLSRQALVVEQRPWLKITNVFAKSMLRWHDDGAHIRVGFIIENVGKTPARFVLVEVDVEPVFANADSSESYKRMSEAAKTRIYDEGHAVFPGDKIEDGANLIIAGASSEIRRRRPVLMCCVSYRNPLDGTIHQTGAAILVEQTTRDLEGVEPIGTGMEAVVDTERLKFTLLPVRGMVID